MRRTIYISNLSCACQILLYIRVPILNIKEGKAKKRINNYLEINIKEKVKVET